MVFKRMEQKRAVSVSDGQWGIKARVPRQSILQFHRMEHCREHLSDTIPHKKGDYVKYLSLS